MRPLLRSSMFRAGHSQTSHKLPNLHTQLERVADLHHIDIPPSQSQSDLLDFHVPHHECHILKHEKLLCVRGLPEPPGVPQSLVCQDSSQWAYMNEEQCGGFKFGVANVYGKTAVEKNLRFFRDELEVPEFDPLRNAPIQTTWLKERRYHVRTFYETVGRELSSAGSPRELVTAIVHSMIGMPSPTF